MQVELKADEAGDANENGYGNIQINKLTNHKILRSGKRVPYGSDGLLGLGKYNGSYYFIVVASCWSASLTLRLLESLSVHLLSLKERWHGRGVGG